MTEEVTVITLQGLNEKTYQKALQIIGQEKIADVIMTVSCMNAWNRIGRSTLKTPVSSQE